MGKEDARRAEAWSLLTLATGAAGRAKGLLASRDGNELLLLMPCSDIHTVGMRSKIDVAFVDRMGCVLEAYRSVGPFRRLRNRDAAAVVERFASCDEPWLVPGDRLAVTLRKGD